MTTHPANDAAPALSLGAKATIQMGSLFIGCRVTEVSRTAHKATLTDSDGTTYPVSRGRDGVYKFDRAYRVRVDESSDNRTTWAD